MEEARRFLAVVESTVREIAKTVTLVFAVGSVSQSSGGPGTDFCKQSAIAGRNLTGSIREVVGAPFRNQFARFFVPPLYRRVLSTN